MAKEQVLPLKFPNFESMSPLLHCTCFQDTSDMMKSWNFLHQHCLKLKASILLRQNREDRKLSMYLSYLKLEQ
jgi:hypothetical protein